MKNGQFAYPRGWKGRLAGHLMALTNHGMNQKVMELMNIQPGDRILEIGFGHGRLIHRLMSKSDCSFVAGIDISETMVSQATYLNKRFIQEGSVRLVRGDVCQLPFEGYSFDRVCSVNNYEFWPDRQKALDEIRRVMKTGGTFLLAIRGKNPDAKKMLDRISLSEHDIDEAQRLIKQAGFELLEVSRHDLPFMTGVMISATRK
ncbi:MAG: methyltransferase domain-containing protein [Bacillaceae bacterium]|nr:methyltransferase domain-containing protein [Bacillaceae bacterium]